MAFSYSLFLVLLLLFPGFCAWAGWRAGERTDFLSPSPDRPNSTLTLFIVMLGTIVGHLLGALSFAAQADLCRHFPHCVAVNFDPNIYKALLRGAASARDASDIAIEAWLFAILLIGAASGAIAFWLSRREWVTARLDPIAFGWLAPAVQAVKKGDSFVVAYVLTKSSHEGASVAYEGTVQQLALDENQAIKMLVLNDVDRFLVKILDTGIRRFDTETTPIAQLQVAGEEIVNVALEVVRGAEIDIEAVDLLEEDGDEAAQ